MMAYFYGVQPKSAGFRLFLGLIRFISEPDAVRFPHITLRGPHERKIERSRLEELNAIVNANRRVRITSPEVFFEQNQNTVVLLVDIRHLRSVWYKPSYPNGSAHITIYDGKERAHAQTIFSALQDYDWMMDISVTSLAPLEPKISESHCGLLRHSSALYKAYEKLPLAQPPHLDEIKDLKFSDRTKLLREVLAVSTMRRAEDLALMHA